MACVDAFLSGFEDSSIHLSSGVIRAGLKSPARQVMAAMWTDSSAQIQGVAVMEDSEAISQGVDDFLRAHVDSNGPKTGCTEKAAFALACAS